MKLTPEIIEGLREELIAECGQSGVTERGIDALCNAALSTLSPSAPTEREKASAWRPISELEDEFTDVIVYELGNGQAIGHRDSMGEWWTPLPLRPLNMNPTHFQPLPPPQRQKRSRP